MLSHKKALKICKKLEDIRKIFEGRGASSLNIVCGGKFIGHLVWQNSTQKSRLEQRETWVGRRNTMNYTGVSRKRQRRIVSNVIVGLLLLGAVVFIGVCPPIGMLCIALVLFS